MKMIQSSTEGMMANDEFDELDRLDDFFAGQFLSRQLFDALATMVDEISPAEKQVMKSQISFVRGKPFAWVWMPGKVLRRKAAPLVLTIVLPHKDTSPRWKEVVEPSAGKFTHHLELYALSDIDDQVRQWLEQAGAYRA